MVCLYQLSPKHSNRINIQRQDKRERKKRVPSESPCMRIKTLLFSGRQSLALGKPSMQRDPNLGQPPEAESKYELPLQAALVQRLRTLPVHHVLDELDARQTCGFVICILVIKTRIEMSVIIY